MDGKAVCPIIEQLIKADDSCYNRLQTGKRIEDFLPGDMVTCGYLKGFFRVDFVFKDTLEIYDIENRDDFYTVSPSFLRKVDSGQETIKILYGQKLT